MRFSLCTLFALLTGSIGASSALAHVSVSATGAYANSTAEASFNVGHGCEGLDTYSIKIKIPNGVTSLRVVENGSFASVATEKDADGNVTSVTFIKAQGAVRAADDAFYKLVLRLKLPNKPFSVLYFPTNQVCKSPDGSITKTTDWIAESSEHSENGPSPAPALQILPPRVPGWNKYTLGAELEITKDQLATVFKDALIAWAGNAAYSVNPNTAAQIEAEEGVETLETISAGTEFWVKY